MGLNPDVLSFAYADMSSVSSPRRPPKNISLGTERLVQFYSSDPEDLGIEIEHSDDGYVRIASTAGDGMFEGTVHAGDIVCEIAGVNMRRPITEHMWRLTTGLMKVAPKPIEVIVAEEHASQEGAVETLGAVVNVPEKNARDIDAENTQSPSLVKQAMSMWQNLNLNGASKEEYHDSPGNGTSDTASMSDGNEGSTIQVHDPYSDPERFGMERNIIFHTESLGVKLHRCPNEGIVQILHVEQSVSEKVRGGDDNGRLEVGDVIVEVGGVDLRHKFIGPLEWADMVYFVQNVGRPLDIVVVEDNHCVRERDGDSGAMYNMEEEVEEDAKDEGEVENTDETEASGHDMSVEEDGDLEAEEEVDDENEAVDQESSIEAEIEEEEEDLEINVEVDVEVNEDVDEEVEQGISNESVAVEEADDEAIHEPDEAPEEETEEDLQIDDECYEQDDKSEHQQEETKEVEKSEEEPVTMTPVEQVDESSDEEPEDVMGTLVEQFVATKEKDTSFSLPVEEEPVQEVEIARTRQQIEQELSQLPKFSPEWFLLKSELVELRVSELVLDENKQASDTGSQKSFVNADNVTLKASKDASGAETEQKRSTSSFYFRTHPNVKSSHVVSSVSEVPSQMKDAESSVVSRETVTTSESSEDPPLTPTSIIEEDDVFEVTMWAGPKVNKTEEDKEATFGQSIFSMDDSDTEEPFTGGINFDAPPRVAASALFSHAFIVNRGGDVGSPLFV
eukprot:scaffold1088_cov120-Skeletonema_dohrnii-CCMP3373.AAC.1